MSRNPRLSACCLAVLQIVHSWEECCPVLCPSDCVNANLASSGELMSRDPCTCSGQRVRGQINPACESLSFLSVEASIPGFAVRLDRATAHVRFRHIADWYTVSALILHAPQLGQCQAGTSKVSMTSRIDASDGH